MKSSRRPSGNRRFQIRKLEERIAPSGNKGGWYKDNSNGGNPHTHLCSDRCR